MEFLRLVFSTLIKVSGTNRVDLALEYQREVVCKLFELLCFIFGGSCCYTLCTGGHFEPVPSLTRSLMVRGYEPGREDHEFDTTLYRQFLSCQIETNLFLLVFFVKLNAN